ncbi:MAG: N-acetylmuramate alpha-1-phosphate uridylyltransferase MurU [Pseudomonadales bacterium]
MALRKAMILAAGRGERMRPLTDTIPKPLLVVNGKPLIDYHLQRLASAGIEDVVINICWLGEKIQAHVGNGHTYGLNVVYSPEPEALETAGGIQNALPLLRSNNDCSDFLILNADVLSDDPLPQLCDFKLNNDLAKLLLIPTPDYLKGDFELIENRILRKSDDPARATVTYAGLGVYSMKMFEHLSAGPMPLLPLLLDAIEKARLAGELLNGQWLDVGTPERLRMAQDQPAE